MQRVEDDAAIRLIANGLQHIALCVLQLEAEHIRRQLLIIQQLLCAQNHFSCGVVAVRYGQLPLIIIDHTLNEQLAVCVFPYRHKHIVIRCVVADSTACAAELPDHVGIIARLTIGNGIEAHNMLCSSCSFSIQLFVSRIQQYEGELIVDRPISTYELFGSLKGHRCRCKGICDDVDESRTVRIPIHPGNVAGRSEIHLLHRVLNLFSDQNTVVICAVFFQQPEAVIPAIAFA